MSTSRPRLHSVPDPAPTPVAVVEQLRALHTAVLVCRGCCSISCSGGCDWGDEYDGELMTVCAHCCIDSYEGKQNWVCLDDHHHGVEYGPPAICSTTAILDGGVSPVEAVAPPRLAHRLAAVTEPVPKPGTSVHDDHQDGPLGPL